MALRALGASGLQVTPIGLGLAGVGRPAYLGFGRDEAPSEERSVEFLQRSMRDLLDAAYSAGLRYAEAHEDGFGVIVKEALANGRLMDPGDPAAGVLGNLAADRGVNVDAVAVAVALANPWVDVVLSGAITAEQLSSNLEALTVQLSASELAELTKLAEPTEAYWSKRQAMPWG